MSSLQRVSSAEKLDSQEIALLAINALNNAVLIFFGPFLSAYFITAGSVQSLIVLVSYYLIMYFCCAAVVPLIGFLLSGKHKHLVLITGVVLFFVMALYVAILKDQLMKHVVFFGVLRGITEQTFAYPFNFFCIDRVSDETRVDFETGRAASSKITSIVLPVLFGGIITATSFMRTSVIILALSAVTIAVSFLVRSDSKVESFRLVKAFRNTMGNRNARTIVLADILTGFYNSVPGVLFPALIFIENTSNMSLGIVTSVASILFLAVQLILNHFNLRRSWLNYIWAGLCIAGAVVYCLHASFTTIVIAYVLYVIGLGLFSISAYVKLFSFVRTGELGSTTKVELWAIRELALGLGRVVAYVLLYLVVVEVPGLLAWAMVFMLATMLPFNLFISRVHTNAD